MQIFIVEDDVFYAELMAKKLSQIEYVTIKIFLDAESCIKKMNLKPDMVISDYYIDLNNLKLDGFAFFRYIKAHYPHLPFVMVSNQNDFRFAMRMMREGVLDFVTKDEHAFVILKKIIEDQQLKSSKGFSLMKNKITEFIKFNFKAIMSIL